MKKRGFALLLAVVLCAGSVSSGVLARTEEAAEEGTEVTIVSEEEAVPETGPAPEDEPGAGAEPEAEAELKTETEPERETDPALTAEPEPETEPEAGEEPVSEAEAEKEPAPAGKEAGGIRPLMAGTGEHAFPIDQVRYLSVTWENALQKTVYSWTNGGGDGNSDQSTVDGLPSGDYVICVNFRESGSPNLLDGVTYNLQLDWPAGDGVTVRLKSESGGTVLQQNEDKDLFSWEVSETGLLSITILNRMDTFTGEVHFTATVTREAGDYPDGDPKPEEASVQKDGMLDEAVRDEINWTVTAVIPRYTEGQAPAWTLQDEMQQSTESYGLTDNDLTAIQVVLASTEFPAGKIIPSVKEAGPDDAFAYWLEKKDRINTTLHFLNRCTCEEGSCADWSDGCGCRYKGTEFCSCWQYIYNAAFTLTYTTDIAEILQAEEDQKVAVTVDITNNACLLKDGEREALDQGTVSVCRPFVKKETVRPDDHDGLGQYEITFDPYEEDYSWADSISITDGMDNLALVAGSLTVKAGKTILRPIDEEDVYTLDPKKDRDEYYSLFLADVTDREGQKTGETMTITIWYPTDQVCTALYDAAILSYGEEPEGTYSNTVRIGSVSYGLSGTYRKGHSGDAGYGYTFSMTLTKVDEEDPEFVLPGAVFEIYRYTGNEGCEEDWLMATETTGEDGTFTFHSDIPNGIFLEEDVLYYLREVQAPLGYRLADTVRGFIFEVDGYTGTLPEGLDPDHVTYGTADEYGSIHIALTEKNQRESGITREVAGAKIWEDHENADGLRPESITIRLLADGVETDSRVVTAKEDWAWSFTGLDFYDADGHAICYTITEDPVKGYETVYHDEDYDVTNVRTLTEKGVDIRGDGVYDNDGEEVRPGDILTYQIRYYNYKQEEACVTVTDPLDEALDFVSASEDGIYDEGTRTITWTIQPVPAGTWGEVTFTAAVNELAREKGEVKNTAFVQIGPDAALETNTVKNPVLESKEELPEAPGKGSTGVKTGDAGHPGRWLALLAAGAAAGLAVLSRRRKTDR